MTKKVSWEEYHQAYANSSAEIKKLIDDEVIGKCLRGSSLQLETGDRYRVIIEFSNYVVNVIDDATLLANLEGIDPSGIHEVLSCVQGAIASTPVQQSSSPVNPVRTMAGDMQNARGEQTYTSNQAAILNQQPTTTNPDDARWQQTS